MENSPGGPIRQPAAQPDFDARHLAPRLQRFDKLDHAVTLVGIRHGAAHGAEIVGPCGPRRRRRESLRHALAAKHRFDDAGAVRQSPRSTTKFFCVNNRGLRRCGLKAEQNARPEQCHGAVMKALMVPALNLGCPSRDSCWNHVST